MNSLIPPIGIVSFALVITAVLILGTRKRDPEAKGKPLGWWWTLGLSMLAGASYTAAGWPFNVVPKLIMGDMVGLATAVVPGVTLSGIALLFLAVLIWVGLTRRQVAVIGIILVHIMAGAGGGFGTLAQRIHAIAVHLAGG
ncbi:hypothetical protein AQJ30_15705 [Streptomyces longwoodensis]|uniref:Uncharacterized protein n=1 Tax=Streptomyces longwoodensis TaxID=68231 RepID=A0A101QXI0_9ACTN|nr:hypothetical protein [Streptomyces longwoodensis]KUN37728.1 hypothetical protein AQJ30_15705 [Streptomyces longwoodensis]